MIRNILTLKNNCWKEAAQYDVDFVLVSDMDEVLYSQKNIKEILYKNINDDVWNTQWYNMISLEFPTVENNQLLHKNENMKMIIEQYPKFLLFNVHNIKETNYDPGAHHAKFQKFNNSPINFFDNENMYLFHFHNVGVNYVLKRNERNSKRMSQINKQMGWGIHYFFDKEHIKNDIINTYKNSQFYSNKI